MKQKICAIILTLATLLTVMTPLVAFADTPSNTFNGEELLFSDWTAAGIGSWSETDGVLSPDGLSEFSMLRLEKDLGEYYTAEFDVKQEDKTSGWQTIQFGFEVNAGENFTQSGLVLDMHNAGVVRVITYADKDKTDGTVGSYGNPYGGNAVFSGSVEWMHIKLVRSGSKYTLTFHDGTEKTISFSTDAFGGGYLVIGAVGSRMVSYKNFKITTSEAPGPEPIPTSATIFNGEMLDFSCWENAGLVPWKEADGIIQATELSDFALLRLNRDLGEYYTAEFDVKQEDNTSGWQTIQFGFEVNAGENFTQSGLVLDMHNAGVARVITYADKDKTDGTVGSYGNPYGGNAVFSATTQWIHVKIVRNGSDFTVTFHDGTEKTISFSTDAFGGGYLVIGAVGSRMVSYQNIVITTSEGPVVDPDPKPDPEPEPEPGADCATTFNGKPLAFSNWSNAAFCEWHETNGIISANEKTDFALLRLNKDLGDSYTIDFDVKQADNYSGWNTIQVGFEVNAGENNTQSGLTLDMHNAGFARVISFKDSSGSGLGSYSNPYGGSAAFSATTDWIHVRIARSGNTFKVTINDGTTKSLVFTAEGFDGGHLVLGSVGYRNVFYKNIVINNELENVDVSGSSDGKPAETIAKDRAVYKEKEGGVNTFNGEEIPFAQWSNAGFTEWKQINGILTPIKLTEFGLLRYDRALGDTYTIELDVKQADVSSGWNTIQLGFDVNAGENFTQSGLTLDLHNAGVARVINFTNRDNKTVKFGSYESPYGGSVEYSATTQWIHIKIERLKTYYTVTINDGTEKVIRFETDEYNGGHLVIGAVGNRDVIYKNVTITDTVTSMAPAEPTYPEEIGTITYNFNGNAFGEWVPTADVWKAEGSAYTQTSETGEQTVWLDSEPLRNFKLYLDYEVLSEKEGVFGISFRKKTGSASYQGLGYSLIFQMGKEGNTLTFADYTASGAASLDGQPHTFELAGNVTVTASGNEFCVWLDDEQIINVTSNAYAFGTVALYTVDCSVDFSNITITSDDLLSDTAKEIVDAFHSGGPLTQEHVRLYEKLSEFQKSLLPTAVKEALNAVAASNAQPGDQDPEETTKGTGKLWIILLACAAAVAAAAAIVIVILRKKAKQHT